MSGQRDYQVFTYREAVFRISCLAFDAVTEEVVRQRHLLEAYIAEDPQFQAALKPHPIHPDAPEVAHRMARAAQLVGVGPMAAVAGAMAQRVAEAGLAAGAEEVIVENGGDIYLKVKESITVGLAPGTAELTRKLAFALEPGDTPIAICSSSGRMGHSMSLGQCDLATVVSRDTALADAAATEAANRVKSIADVDAALESIAAIEGIKGVLIIKDDRIGLAGTLPSLVKIC